MYSKMPLFGKKGRKMKKKKIIKPKLNNTKSTNDKFPKKFPFWARLKIGKNRPTLVIDKDKIIDKVSKKVEDAFVNREVTHTYKKEYLEIKPNPDSKDPNPMYLRRPTKMPKRLFKPNNRNIDMPQILIDMYDKNNKK